ncbi:MAG: flagellar FliJ family protein [Sulfurospirillum sp.]|nr:flagellar FliJ family protein [Sulfurospirillum sp.]MBL0703274.1 flagellar FliJ family protein [Sulfurospirillum sp.]
MRSKFTSIAKVRKQQRDIIETHLAKARFEKHEIKQKIISLYKDIDKIKTPTSGNIFLMNIAREKLVIMRKAKDILNEKLFAKNIEIDKLKEQYKLTNIEFEKIKYLEEQDFQESIKKIKKEESLNMDEIANMLFINKGRN